MRKFYFAQDRGCLWKKKKKSHQKRVCCASHRMLAEFLNVAAFMPTLCFETRWCGITVMRCPPCHVDVFEKGQRASHFDFWQAVNPNMTSIHCPRFENNIMIFPDLVNLRWDRHLYAIFEGNLIGFSAINEDRNDGCCLVHAINVVNGSSLSDRCFRDYRLRYKYIDQSHRRVTFVISESYR